MSRVPFWIFLTRRLIFEIVGIITCYDQDITMMKLYFILLALLPLFVRTNDEVVTCFDCSVDEDCDKGICVENHCTDEFGLFENGCSCQTDIECASGACHRVCEHFADNATTCTDDSACGRGICSRYPRCVGTDADEPSESGIMPFWVAVIVIIGGIGGLLAFVFVTRKESCAECCCEGFMGCCCLFCNA
jgi:hypothetical protein